MKNHLTYLAPLILLAAIAAPRISHSQPPPPVRIGANLPMTGELASFGTAVKEGVLLAQKDLDAAGPAGVRLNFDWQDNRSDPKQAVSILREQLLSPPALFVVGVKPQYLAIHDQLAKQGIPSFVWVFDTHIRPAHENNFRTWVNFKVEPPLFIEYAKKRQPKRIAIIYVQLPHTEEEYQTAVIPGLKSAGFSDILVEPYQLNKQEFADTALRVKRFAPDLIFLCGFQDNLVSLVKALNNLKLIKDGNTVASYDMQDAAPILNPREIEGIRVSAPRFLLRPDMEHIKAWNAKFEAAYHTAPLYTHAYAYDMTMIMAEAAKKLALPASQAEWMRALAAVDMEGITGRLKFDSEGDLPPEVDLGVFRGGKLQADTTKNP